MKLVQQHILSALSLAALLAVSLACTKDPSFGGSESQAEVEIRTAISGAASATRGPVSGTAFPNWGGETSNNPNGTYGIFACVHEETPSAYSPHKPALYNARAGRVSGKWRYYLVGEQSSGALDGSYSSKYILTSWKKESPSDPDVTADLYAYAPWTLDAHASGPTAIPFETAKQWDWMYAQENGVSNRDLNPSGTGLPATFTFKHVMARLDFNFRLLNVPTTYDISLVSVTRSDGAHLYASGTLNALTGELGNLVEEDSLSPSVAALRVNSTSEATLSVLLVPEAFESSEKLTFLFRANGANGQILQPFVLTKDLVEHSDHSFGLRAGYTYTYHFTLDNYILFDGFSVSTTWTTPTDPADDLNPIDI